jgi:hypothetical protein
VTGNFLEGEGKMPGDEVPDGGGDAERAEF